MVDLRWTSLEWEEDLVEWFANIICFLISKCVARDFKDLMKKRMSLSSYMYINGKL